ncbi:hypothetical protein EUTSA_v10026940mg, partial [Eutrema salsugineum]
MASSSSRSWRYDVFPSFSGEVVRKSFLSHLLKELDRKSINAFIDDGIERSRPIGPELLSAIRESRISIVVFSKSYASSTCVDPSEVRKHTGEFGKVFKETCDGKTEDQKQRWMQALVDVANMAGEDLRNWCNEASMIEKIADDVSNKLITTSDCYGDLVGIEAHLEAMSSILCLESEEARMVGILGPSGIGKSTIGRALFKNFLSEILGQKDLQIYQLGAVEQRLKLKKVLIVLDDVDDIELLKTLVGQTEWFGSGSRIIVITQDRQLLKAHEIDLIYEVKFPSQDSALKMLCQSAFRQNSPPNGLMELTVEAAKLAGNLPLCLSVLGSSLRRKDKKEWEEMLPRLQNGLDGKIEKILRVGYDRLDGKDQELFLFIAFAGLFNGLQVSYIRLNDVIDVTISVSDIKCLLGDGVTTGLTVLTDKSLIRITPHETIEMHNSLQKLAREIGRAESINNPGKRRYLVDVEDICDVFTDKTINFYDCSHLLYLSAGLR